MQNFLKKYNIKYFYHFTDISNLKSIQENGLLSLSEIKNRDIDVTIFGGNKWSHQADNRFGVDKYVHLAFETNHPMLYFAHQNKRIMNPIWLTINTNIIFQDGVKFTNQVANQSDANLYDLSEIEEVLDSEVLFTRTDWTNFEIQKRLKKARKSELLIPNHIPISHISW